MAGLFFQQYSKLSVPIPLANLKLWLKADAGVTLNGSNVSLWSDQSGSGNNASQGVAINQPTYVTNQLNGNPILRFDGNDYLSCGDVLDLGTHGYSMFVVYNKTSGVNANIVGKTKFDGIPGEYSLGSLGVTDYSSYLNVGITPHASGTFNQSNFLYSTIIVYREAGFNQTNKIYANGTIKGQITTNYAVNSLNIATTFTVGATATPAFYLNGDIAEIIYYDTNLDGTKQATIENYLKAKYGL